MPLSTEQQVQAIANILRAVKEDVTWQVQGGLRPAMPCSFSELNAWTSRMPDPAVHHVIDEVMSRMMFINRMVALSPDDLQGLGTLTADDPRLPTFLATLSAAWPSPDQVRAITDLYGCVLRTLRQAAAARPNMDPASPIAKGLDNAARLLKLSGAEVDGVLSQAANLLPTLVSFRPDARTAVRIVGVSSPEINRLFSSDGQLKVQDKTAAISLAKGSSGAGFLQSRTGPVGKPGTAAADLTPYMYRISLTGMSGSVGVISLELPVSSVSTLNFADAGIREVGELFVVVRGGLGSVQPSSAQTSAGRLKITFDPPLGAGLDSFFFGFATPGAPHSRTAKLTDTSGITHDLDSTAPA